MRVRSGPIFRIVVITCTCMGCYAAFRQAADWVERRMPDLADKPMQIAERQIKDAWNFPSKGFHAMRVVGREGTVMGRVKGNCWQAAGRIYYQVHGPVSPEANASEKEKIEYRFCEAEYSNGQRLKLERFMLSGTTKLWKYYGRATARSIVSKKAIRSSTKTTMSHLHFGLRKVNRQKQFISIIKKKVTMDT